MSKRAASRNQAGFSLIEAVIAMGVLTVGLLGLAQAFYLGMRHTATSSANLVAREKAREAVESVHTARDTGNIVWAEIRNVANGGIFLDNEEDLHSAGADGLVNTADDATAPIEVVGFRRRVQILELSPVNADLRQIVVTITYQLGARRGTYTLRTFISSFS
jgi:Tfp pilus assembly protein PilW